MLPIDYGPPSDPHDGPAEPLVESVWVEPYPDARLGLDAAVAGPEARYEQRESVELAFIAALQHLPPKQRAVLILRDVLGFSGAEAADALDTTTPPSTAPCSAPTARSTSASPSRASRPRWPRSATSACARSPTGYVRAWERGDVAAVVAMLADDATVTMPPRPTWYRGRDAAEEFLRTYPLADHRRSVLYPAAVNAQLAFGHYFWEPVTRRYLPHGVTVLTLRGPLIADITTFLDPADFERLELPSELGAVVRGRVEL